jgi:hypothetical protein
VAATELDGDAAPARPDGPFDPWTNRAVQLGLVPLLGWDAASVFLLAVACHVDAWVAWIPAMSTSGIMLAAARISTRSIYPEVRRNAAVLSWVGLALGITIAAIQHVLPSEITVVPWPVLALIGALPVAMGGWLWHIYATAQGAHAAHLAAQGAARVAATEAARNAELTAITAQRERAAQLAHAQELATIAAQRASAEREAADATARKLTAERKLTSEVAAVAAGPRPVPGRKPESPGRQAPLRKAAIAELTRRHRAGQDITQTVSAELDRTIGASVGYTKKIISDLVAAVLNQERGVA